MRRSNKEDFFRFPLNSGVRSLVIPGPPVFGHPHPIRAHHPLPPPHPQQQTQGFFFHKNCSEDQNLVMLDTTALPPSGQRKAKSSTVAGWSNLPGKALLFDQLAKLKAQQNQPSQPQGPASLCFQRLPSPHHHQAPPPPPLSSCQTGCCCSCSNHNSHSYNKHSSSYNKTTIVDPWTSAFESDNIKSAPSKSAKSKEKQSKEDKDSSSEASKSVRFSLPSSKSEKAKRSQTPDKRLTTDKSASYNSRMFMEQIMQMRQQKNQPPQQQQPYYSSSCNSCLKELEQNKNQAQKQMKQKPPPTAMAPAVAANKVSIPRPHPLRKTVSKEQLSNIRSRSASSTDQNRHIIKVEPPPAAPTLNNHSSSSADESIEDIFPVVSMVRQMEQQEEKQQYHNNKNKALTKAENNSLGERFTVGRNEGIKNANTATPNNSSNNSNLLTFRFLSAVKGSKNSGKTGGILEDKIYGGKMVKSKSTPSLPEAAIIEQQQSTKSSSSKVMKFLRFARKSTTNLNSLQDEEEMSAKSNSRNSTPVVKLKQTPTQAEMAASVRAKTQNSSSPTGSAHSRVTGGSSSESSDPGYESDPANLNFRKLQQQFLLKQTILVNSNRNNNNNNRDLFTSQHARKIESLKNGASLGEENNNNSGKPSMILPVFSPILLEEQDLAASQTLKAALSKVEAANPGDSYDLVLGVVRKGDMDGDMNEGLLRLQGVEQDNGEFRSNRSEEPFQELNKKSFALKRILARIPDEIVDRKTFLETIKDIASAIKKLLDAMNQISAFIPSPANRQSLELKKREFVKYSKKFSNTLKEYFREGQPHLVFSSATYLIYQTNQLMITVKNKSE